MMTHFILIGHILWWQARCVLRVYSNNSIPIILTNLCFYNSKSFFSVVALLSWVILIKNTDKSTYIPTLLVFKYYVYVELILEQMALY